MTLVVPGMLTVITPPTEQVHMLPLWMAGMPRMVTVEEPSVQGEVAGTQGVGTPAAAAVRTLQFPNGFMFIMGTKSMMLAAGCISAVTGGPTTVSADGAAPDVQESMAPFVTNRGIAKLLE
jgi:hypothetical protein